MTIIWKKLSISSICIDQQSFASKCHRIEVNLNEGIHRIDVFISNISTSELRRKILLNWISNLCGAVVYTIEDAYIDVYDDKISFVLSVNNDQIIDIDEVILTLKTLNSKMTKEINSKKLKLVKRLYLFPVILFGSLLSAIFLTLGITTIRYNNVGIGIFSIVIAMLSLLLTIGLIAKQKKHIKK